MNRLVRWRVALRWYLVALYGFPVVGLWTVLFFGAASLRQVFAELPYAFVTLSFNTLTSFLVLGPLGEEPGWRGFALPRLLMDHSPLRASLILGFVWAYWHAPLMLVPEWRSGLSIGLFVVLYPLNVVALTIIFTWISRQTTGSVLISMLLHSAYNATVYYLDNAFDLGRYDPLMVLGGTAFVLWLTVLALIAVFGPRLDGRRHTP